MSYYELNFLIHSIDMANQQTLLRNLHTFHVAAKTLSFTLTAKELNLTQGAVSYRMKVLEESIGFNLFTRGTRKLSLTEEGQRFHATLAKSLTSIFGEIEDIRTTELAGEITIAAAPQFAASWLMPRLSDFKERHPKFNLNILVYEEQEAFFKEDIDVAIVYGDETPKDMYVRPLFGERYVPVCTPEYATKFELFDKGIDALVNINFLHALGSDVWQRWVNYHGIDVDIFEQFYCVGHRGLGVTAALSSVGVAMGRYHFVKKHIEKGELVSPLPAMPTDKHYYLVCPNGHEKRPKIQTFIRWLDNQII
ncbi:LysR substrate-binding domain-containing protein [Vibrio sp. 10N]|nr:LysR substrate-binding domain-containing protein [Vibrio sp. 10N]